MPTTVVTVGTDDGMMRRLDQSCRRHGFELVALGIGQEWTGFGMKCRLTLAYLSGSSLADDDFVVFTDAYDTLCQERLENVQTKLQLLIGNSGKCLSSAEIYLWPASVVHTRGYFESIAPPLEGWGHERLPPQSIFPCAGQWAGTKTVLIRTLKRLLDRMGWNDAADDQEALILDTVENPDLHLMDYDSRVFQANVYHLTNHTDAATFNPQRKTSQKINALLAVKKVDGAYVLTNLRSQVVPSFLHTNGSGSHMLDTLRTDYVEPLEMLWRRPKGPTLPRVYAVTLPDRRERVRAFAETHRFDVVQWDATTSTDLAIPEGLSRSEFMCALSHRALLEHHRSTHPNEAVVILEDDVGASHMISGEAPVDAASRHVRAFLASKEYDVLLLGRCWDRCDLAAPGRTDSDELIEPGYVNCTHAYVVAPWGLSKILSEITDNLVAPLDHVFDNARASGRVSYIASNPPILKQVGLMTQLAGQQSRRYNPAERRVRWGCWRHTGDCDFQKREIS